VKATPRSWQKAECRHGDQPVEMTTTKRPVVHGSRKIVTVLFVDMVDSTVLGDDLDAESFRALMERYYEVAHDAVARHGGHVEKFIGDAVMAVFGIPKLHEDDALRAVTAAVELRDRIDALNEEFLRAYGRTVAIRTGVESGEAVASERGWAELYVTGPTVNTAARLEQAASPGTVLIGEATYHLVRDAVVVGEPRVLALKGKREEVMAWAVQGIIPGAAGLRRRLNAELVDRQDELRRLLAAFDRAASSGCQLVTVVGDAGIGKTRLAKELIARLEERARVLTGRCLPYGEGITFWPVVEVLRDAAGIAATDSPAQSIGKLRALLRPGHEGELITARLAGLLGDEVAQPAVQELFWAIRKLLEQLAATRPVVVLFDDIHWAEPTFLQMLEYLADWAGRAPVLVGCLARGELLDVRPDWATPRPNAELIPLLPLSDDETRQLVGGLVGGDRVDAAAEARISTVAEGNPLFVEEMLRMLADSGQLRSEAGQWVLDRSVVRVPIPTTIQALMSARLERLEPDQLEVLERAAVVGEVFGWSAVAALSDGNGQAVSTAAHLQALMRKQLIRPRRDDPGDEDAFEFSHALVHDAAYLLIPKTDRVDLHERFATWVEHVMSEGSAAYEEIVGYHLEQAHHTLLELGPESPRSAELADRAFARLSVAGLRAHSRGDMPAAVNLLDRAVRLLDRERAERTAVLPRLAFALMETGAFGALEDVVAEIEAAAGAGDDGMRARATVLRLWMRPLTDPVGWAEAAEVEAGRVMRAFTELRDERGLATTSLLLGLVSGMQGRFAEAEARFTEASVHARRAGDQRDELEALSWVPLTIWLGPTPSADGLRRCREMLVRADDDKKAMASALLAEATFEAGLGSFEDARGSLARAHDLLTEVALSVWLAGPYAQFAGWVELLAGDIAAAERVLRAGCDTLRKIGEMSWYSTVAGLLGEAVLQTGRRDEAEALAEASRDAAAPDDVYSQVIWRTVASTADAQSGLTERSERLAREAVDLVRRTDFLHLHWYALMSLARVLELLGRIPDAASAADEAAEAARLKGSVVAERRARETATRLRA
jgi:class 3 adenylate cyclase/tetratricopeptide (TPR) repeat protein